MTLSQPHQCTIASTRMLLRAPTPADDKYSRGVVGIRTGSHRYPGAAVIGVEGAWRSGVGMVRYVGEAAGEVLARRPETVIGTGRCEAWVVGSGTDAAERSANDTAQLQQLMSGHAPVVVDAGAIDLGVQAALRGDGAPLVFTPHAGEFARLCAAQSWTDCQLPSAENASAASPSAVLAQRAQVVARAAERLQQTVVLKGYSTLIAAPGEHVYCVESATPWLAVAGAGDVLGGVIGAVIAQHPDAAVHDAAAAAVWLHGHAARIAAGVAGTDAGIGRPIVAMDVAEALPYAVHEVLTHDAE
ncbi:ADP-dependent NAD(P)H-hydrate dehydratase [Microbacterium sp. YY-01]|uniref:ADP-dependent NAD(P)H-hydrate dehydratase n=1 Tax=Microbacterium sp. YY-01 TaxID=3421634 RepID=UPI003D1710DB